MISPTDVHFIVNNTFAINNLCGGNPFACTVGRNVTRTQPRNQVDLSVQKNFKLYERLSLTLRADALNAFNHQFYGAPGLNINNKNAAGVGSGGTPADRTPSARFGVTQETSAASSSRRTSRSKLAAGAARASPQLTLTEAGRLTGLFSLLHRPYRLPLV